MSDRDTTKEQLVAKKRTVKDLADYITLSNDDDGVAHVINKFMLDDR